MFQQPVPSGACAPLEDCAEKENPIKGLREVRYLLTSPCKAQGRVAGAFEHGGLQPALSSPHGQVQLHCQSLSLVLCWPYPGECGAQRMQMTGRWTTSVEIAQRLRTLRWWPEHWLVSCRICRAVHLPCLAVK